jgi:2-polyprenyl-3-methyl-5-hydroxy-6-metoxy-1,4-benzoquinol methylase
MQLQTSQVSDCAPSIASSRVVRGRLLIAARLGSWRELPAVKGMRSLGTVARVINLVRDHGVSGLVKKWAGRIIDLAIERSAGIDTVGTMKLDGLSVSGRNRLRGNEYEGMRWMPLREVIPELQLMVDPESALVDCGCGKGKVLLVAAECGVQKVRGVEFAKELCEIAESNWKKVQLKRPFRCSFQVHHLDVLEYSIQPDDSMFFFFNPFDTLVLASFLENVVQSHRQHPRKIALAVAFLSDSYRDVFQQQSEIVFRKEVVYWACRFSLFSIGDLSP